MEIRESLRAGLAGGTRPERRAFSPRAFFCLGVQLWIGKIGRDTQPLEPLVLLTEARRRRSRPWLL
jgi:hypothetical protein